MQCTSVSAAKKLFGGDMKLTRKLLARINAIEQAPTLLDIVLSPYHFHNLENRGKSRLKGCYAMDVNTHHDAWRIILRPLDQDGNPLEESIDRIAASVEIVRIEEVSKHYG